MEPGQWSRELQQGPVLLDQEVSDAQGIMRRRVCFHGEASTSCADTSLASSRALNEANETRPDLFVDALLDR